MPGAGGSQATVPAHGPEGARGRGGGEGGGAESAKHGDHQPAADGAAADGAQYGATAAATDGPAWAAVGW